MECNNTQIAWHLLARKLRYKVRLSDLLLSIYLQIYVRKLLIDDTESESNK